MTRFTRSVTMKPPGWVDRVWYWWIKERPPFCEGLSHEIKGLKWARLVPMRFQDFHERFARRHSLHWGPCVLCMRPYGGHQSAGGVPDPTQPPPGPDGPWYYVGICPRCTRAGKSVRS